MTKGTDSTFLETITLAKPIIHEICSMSGTPGLAIGVFNKNGPVFGSYHGHRDIKTEQAPNADTIFNIGDLSQGFTALAIALLVDEGKLHWNDHIGRFLDSYNATDVAQFTIRDLLSHRTGLSRADALFLGSDNHLLLTKAQGTDIFTTLNISLPPRQDFIYNTLGYHAAACIIERVTSMSYGDFLRERIFKPLNMNRTYTKLPPVGDDNVARAYYPYYNREVRRVPVPQISDDTVAFGAGSVRSSLRDLIAFYSALLGKFEDGMSKSVFDIFQASILLRSESLREQSYGMGWARTQLPNQMSQLSGNSGLLDDYPTLGDASHGPLVLHHGGQNLGSSATVYLMPELDRGIIVLGNALGHCDATDWTAQIITEVLLSSTIKTPFLEYAEAAASHGRSAMARVKKQLDKEKPHGDPPTDLEKYTGVFWHKTRHFRITIRLRTTGEKKGLEMLLQGLETERYTLHHYFWDTFVFNETYDQIVDRGQRCRPYWFYKIEFLRQGLIPYAIRWRIDETEEQGQTFMKGEIWGS